MSDRYQFVSDLTSAVTPPADGTLSRTIHQDERTKVVLFGFSAGQELSEHTASRPAIMHFLSGEGSVTLGGDRMDIAAGSWVHMPAGLRHAIQAKTPLVMLLTLL